LRAFVVALRYGLMNALTIAFTVALILGGYWIWLARGEKERQWAEQQRLEQSQCELSSSATCHGGRTTPQTVGN
jgi:hypothetical protein